MQVPGASWRQPRRQGRGVLWIRGSESAVATWRCRRRLAAGYPIEWCRSRLLSPWSSAPRLSAAVGRLDWIFGTIRLNQWTLPKGQWTLLKASVFYNQFNDLGQPNTECARHAWNAIRL